MKNLRQRKSIRLKGYDYSQEGCYFVTICTKNREFIFGDVDKGEMRLSAYGTIAKNEILNISKHYANVEIDVSTVMPNHVHMIVRITSVDRAPPAERINPTERINPFPTNVDIPNIIGKYKAGVTRLVGNAFMRSASTAVGSANVTERINPFPTNFETLVIWQKSYHDHIIQSGKSYDTIFCYIENNPMQWETDCHNPQSPNFVREPE